MHNKKLDFIKNFSNLIKKQNEINFQKIKFHFEIEENNIVSFTLIFDYILKGENLSHVLCFYGKTIKEQVIDHLSTFFQKVDIKTSQNDMDYIEKILTFLELMFSNIKEYYNIEEGNFYISIPLPFKENCMVNSFIFKGKIDSEEYIFEKDIIEFNEYDVFYPAFLLENNIDLLLKNKSI